MQTTVVSIKDIANTKVPATREELTELWKQYVDPNTPDMVIRLLSDAELRNMVLICVCVKNRRSHAFGVVIRTTATAVGISKSTAYRLWARARKDIKLG